MRAAALALLLAIGGCREPEPGAGDGGARTQLPDSEPPWPGITLDLRPDVERGELAVTVRVSGERAAAIGELAVARSWADTHGADAIADVRVRDRDGDLALQPRGDGSGADRVLGLAHAPRGGELILRYRALSGAPSSRFALHVTPDRLSGVGHAFLLLPRIDASLPARVRVHTDGMQRGADAASTFGFGREVVTSATSEDLAHAVYVAGTIWQETGPGAESLIVLGEPPFDTRTALARSADAAAALDRFFGRAPPAEPLRFVIAAQPGLGTARDGAWLGRSVALWMDAAQPFDGGALTAIAHELTHRVLGGSVRLVAPDGREAMWFSEGFTVHFARRALLEAGLITAADFAADLDRTFGDGGDRPPVEYRRGARLAAIFDAGVRRASQGKRALDDVVKDLLAQAGAAGSPTLPVGALRDALTREIGDGFAAEFDRLTALPEAAIDLPADAFGPCARRRSKERSIFELGFDRESLTVQPTFIRGLVAGGPAERAGIKEGMIVLKSRVPSASDALAGKGEVELRLAGGKRASFRPVTTRQDVSWVAAPCEVRAAAGSGPAAPAR